MPGSRRRILGGGYYWDSTSFWPALTVANAHIQYLRIGNFRAEDVPQGGLNVRNQTGEVHVTNLTAINCYRVADGHAQTILENVFASGCRGFACAPQVRRWHWEDACEDKWARLIRNGAGSGGYSDPNLYKAPIQQATTENALNVPQRDYLFEDGEIQNLGPLVAFRATSLFMRKTGKATVVTEVPHRLQNGDRVNVAHGSFIATNVAVTVVNSRTFSYPDPGPDVTRQSLPSGIVTPDFSVTTVNAAFAASQGARACFRRCRLMSECAPDATYSVLLAGPGSSITTEDCDFSGR